MLFAPNLPDANTEVARLHQIIAEARRVLEPLVTGEKENLDFPADEIMNVMQILNEGVPSAEPIVFSKDPAMRNSQIRALVSAPASVREATLRASATVSESIYGSDPEVAEFTDALMNDDFYGFDEDEETEVGEHGR